MTKSVIKWVGGKRQLLATILDAKLPPVIHNFYEPFGGSLTVSLYVIQNRTVTGTIYVSDINNKLVTMYNHVKTVPELVIQKMQEFVGLDDYYTCRAMFNDSVNHGTVTQSALFLILNKTGFNGLYRVNKKGQYNVPIGRNTVNWDNQFDCIRELSNVLNKTNIVIEALGYDIFFKKYQPGNTGDVVYADPPYWDTFCAYDGHGFSKNDQEQLCKYLTKVNATVIASNSNTDFIKDLYTGAGFDVEVVNAARYINRDGTRRGKQPVEVVMTKNKK